MNKHATAPVRFRGPERVGAILAGLVAPVRADPAARGPGGLPRWVVVHPEGDVGCILELRARSALVETELQLRRWSSPETWYIETRTERRWIELRRLSPYNPARTITPGDHVDE